MYLFKNRNEKLIHWQNILGKSAESIQIKWKLPISNVEPIATNFTRRTWKHVWWSGWFINKPRKLLSSRKFSNQFKYFGFKKQLYLQILNYDACNIDALNSVAASIKYMA